MATDPSYSTSVEVTRTLTEALQKGDPDAFDLVEYNKVRLTAKELAVESKRVAQSEELEEILAGKTEGDKRRIRRLAETGVWMLAMPIHLNGTFLMPTEFRNNLALCCGYPPPHRSPHSL